MVYYLIGLLATFTLYAQDEIPKLDPNKFTICAITINSDNERAVFEAEVKKNPAKFNPIVELTEFGGEDWFDKACNSKLRCDQLIVSGHFGGEFFGSSGKRLSLGSLEEKGCSKTCEGILDNPYEVFLFGCNTLSTKEMDHRTPEEYLQVLLADGIPHDQALLVVESRYGVTGDDHKTKMQRAFGGLKKQLYGFDSVGPSGKNVQGFLKNYLSQISLSAHLEKIQAKRLLDHVDLTNNKLATALKTTAFTQCQASDLSGNRSNVIICGLQDSRNSADAKVAFMIEALSDEKFLTYVHAINSFLKTTPISQLSKENQVLIDSILQSSKIQDQVSGLIRSTTNYSMLVEWTQFAENLGILSEEEKKSVLKKNILGMFVGGVTINEKDIMCSTRVKNLGVTVTFEDISSLKLGETEYRALACLKVKDKKIHLKIAEGIKSPKARVRYEAIDAISDLSSEPEVLLTVSKALSDPDRDVRMMSARALAYSRSKDARIHASLADQLLVESEWDISARLIEALRELKPSDPTTQLKVIKALSTRPVTMVSQLIGSLTIVDEATQLSLLESIRGAEAHVKLNSLKAFLNAPALSKTVQLKLLEFYPSGSALDSTVLEIFKKVKPRDQEILEKLFEIFLSEKDKKNKILAAEIFQLSKPQNHSFQLKLIDQIYLSEASVAVTLLSSFEKNQNLSPDIQELLAESISKYRDSSGTSLANGVVKIFSNLQSIQLDSQKKLLDGFKVNNEYVRTEFSKLFLQILPSDPEVQLALLDHLGDESMVSKPLVEMFSKLEFKDERVLAKVLGLLQGPASAENQGKLRAASLILASKPAGSKSLQLQYIDKLTISDWEVGEAVSKGLEKIDLRDKDIQLKLVRTLSNDHFARVRTMIDKARISDPEVLRALKEIDRDLWRIKKNEN